MANLDKYTKPQKDAITTINGRMIVSASAGSGKTTVMMERICAVVESGAVQGQASLPFP